MVEIRVAVPNASRSMGLVHRLVGMFGGSSVSIDRARHEVCVRSESESRSVVQVIELVQSWLATDGDGPVTLWVGSRSHELRHPSLAPASERPE